MSKWWFVAHKPNDNQARGVWPYKASKSRKRTRDAQHQGGFRLTYKDGRLIAGKNYNLSAAEVLAMHHFLEDWLQPSINRYCQRFNVTKVPKAARQTVMEAAYDEMLADFDNKVAEIRKVLAAVDFDSPD